MIYHFKPTYSYTEILRLIQNCDSWEIASAIEYVVRAESRRYTHVQLLAIIQVLKVRVYELRRARVLAPRTRQLCEVLGMPSTKVCSTCFEKNSADADVCTSCNSSFYE